MTALPTPGGLPLGPMGGMPFPPVPGIDVVQKLLQSLGLDPTILVSLGMAFTVFASLGGFLTYAWNGLSSVWALVSNNCVSSATIHSSDQAFLYIMKWLATQKISTDCREFVVTSKKNPNSARVKRYSMYNYHTGGGGPDDDDDDDEEDDLGPKLKYNPAPGWSHFWFRKHLIIMQRKVDRAFYNGEEPDETMVLMTIGRSPTLLRALLSEARAHYVASESRKTTVYSVNSAGYQKGWDNGRSRASRDISTVIMEKQDKELILRDTKDYLNPVTARWYAARGLPYRRGYLFYGPPGTGKTSLTLALAGELKLNLYIFNLGAGGGVTGETLGQLFQALPRKCIVLLEDIDCAGIGRGFSGNEDYESESSDDEELEDEEESQEEGGVKATQGETTDSKAKDSKTRNKAGSSSHGRTGSQTISGRSKHSQVSFSGLLNAIDGVASHEGRILIMTTNHRERLDPALIRPGRVDLQIEFGYSTHDTIRRVFTELYKGLGNLTPSPTPVSLSRSATCEDEDDFGSVWQSSGSGSPTTAETPSHKFDEINPSTWSANHLCRRDSIRDADLEDLAERFAKAVPGGVFTPAELQGYLMMHKHDPRTAVRGVGDWVRGKLIEKGKNPDGSAAGNGARKKKSGGGRVPTGGATGGKVKEAATPATATTTTAVTSLNSPGKDIGKPLTQKPQSAQPRHVIPEAAAQPPPTHQPPPLTTRATTTSASSQPQHQHQSTRILRQRRTPPTITRQQSWETSDGVSTVGSSGAATDSGGDEDDDSEPNNDLQPHKAPATTPPALLPAPPIALATPTKKGGRSSAARKKLKKAIKGVAS